MAVPWIEDRGSPKSQSVGGDRSCGHGDARIVANYRMVLRGSARGLSCDTTQPMQVTDAPGLISQVFIMELVWVVGSRLHRPLQRFGEADDIAYATLFLCSREAGFISGAQV